MATLIQHLERAKKLKANNLEKDLFKFIKSIEKDLLELEKERISEKSKDIFGEALGYYSKATEIITKGKKKAGEPFTGIDSGDWFDAFYMQEVAGVLRFSSKDEKNSTILNSDNWNSNQVFGLDDEQLKGVIRERLLPFFIKNSRDILGI